MKRSELVAARVMARVGLAGLGDGTSKSTSSPPPEITPTYDPSVGAACKTSPLFPPEPQTMAAKILLGAGVLFSAWLGVTGALAMGGLGLGASLVGSKLLDDALKPCSDGPGGVKI